MSTITPGGRIKNRSTATVQTKRNNNNNNNNQTPTKQSSRTSMPVPTQPNTRRRTQAVGGVVGVSGIAGSGGGSTGGGGDAGTSRWLSGRLEKPTIASTMRAASNRKKHQESIKSATTARNYSRQAKTTKLDVGTERRKTRETAGSYTERKPLTTTAKSAARARLWPQRKPSNKDTSSKTTKQESKNDNEASDCEAQAAAVDIQNLQELGIQTNEAEILNHDLLIGDIKLMLPSKDLMAQLDKERDEVSVSQQRKIKAPPIRKLDAFEERKQTHLSELEEFMERNCIKKRPIKEPINTFNQSAILRSMDELLTRDVPRAESITEIRERIRRKENELMQLFDDVDEPKENPATDMDAA